MERRTEFATCSRNVARAPLRLALSERSAFNEASPVSHARRRAAGTGSLARHRRACQCDARRPTDGAAQSRSKSNATLRGPDSTMSIAIDALWPLRSSACVGALRSEEHTSELQSLMRISYAVFC